MQKYTDGKTKSGIEYRSVWRHMRMSRMVMRLNDEY
jgi:hypothetical protein